MIEPIRAALLALAELGWQAPLLALAASLLARLLLAGPAAALGVALALAAGWLSLAWPFAAWHLAVPHGAPESLSVVALGAAVVTLLATRGPGALLVLALAGGWWLAGAPNALAAHAVLVAFLAACLWFGGRGLVASAPWAAFCAALGFALALPAAGIWGIWPPLALVPAAVLLPALFGAPAGLALLPVGVGLGGAAALAALATGRLPHGGVGTPDLAALTPLLVLAAPGWLRRLGPRAAPPVVAALAVVAVFIIHRLGLL